VSELFSRKIASASTKEETDSNLAFANASTKVDFKVPEKYLPTVRTGQHIEIKVDA
jgi:membrane fusion protein (multidrug efflux system)